MENKSAKAKRRWWRQLVLIRELQDVPALTSIRNNVDVGATRENVDVGDAKQMRAKMTRTDKRKHQNATQVPTVMTMKGRFVSFVIIAPRTENPLRQEEAQRTWHLFDLNHNQGRLRSLQTEDNCDAGKLF